jgi:hypothetical protein
MLRVIRPSPAGSYPPDIKTSATEYEPSSGGSTSDESSDDERQPGNLPCLRHELQPVRVKRGTNFTETVSGNSLQSFPCARTGGISSVSARVTQIEVYMQLIGDEILKLILQETNTQAWDIRTNGKMSSLKKFCIFFFALMLYMGLVRTYHIKKYQLTSQEIYLQK